MTKSGITIKALASLIFAFALSATTQAQTRTFVSGLGSDANPCTRISPCRSFQRAHDVVIPGGEVIAIDSAGYGPITITKSVSIIGDGNYAGINTRSGDGITISTAGIAVNLRSLTIEGVRTGNNGIIATDFTVLHIENCIVNGFSGDGIAVLPSAAGTRTVFIKDTIFRNNGGIGIDLLAGDGTALIAAIEGTRTENNFYGIFINGSGATVTARGCLASDNSDFGFRSSSGGVLNIESSVASNNHHGISTFDGTVRVSTSTVTNNTGFGFLNSGSGTFESRGNNTLAGNNNGGAQTSGTITAITAL
jgi:hypothetical protein